MIIYTVIVMWQAKPFKEKNFNLAVYDCTIEEALIKLVFDTILQIHPEMDYIFLV
jgi:hypothetical protein